MKRQQFPENLNQGQTANETITQLAHRHLKDRSHTTTDEELRKCTN